MVTTPQTQRLTRDFFSIPTLELTRRILGARLVHEQDGRRLAGIIVEAEAYVGQADLGCHASAGMTQRNRVMFSAPGHAYVYFTYGMHWLLNVVAEPQGTPAAVLIRAIRPSEGLDVIASRRNGKPPASWTDGPAKLCQALGIDGKYNGLDLCAPASPLFLEAAQTFTDDAVHTSARIGLNRVPEPWKSIPWRFYVS